MSHDIVPKRSAELQSRAANLVKRGFKILENPTEIQETSRITRFLDAIGGIPDDNRDPRVRDINSKLTGFFSKISMPEIANVLENEYKKRPNGRTLKLLGMAYSCSGQVDKSIETLENCLSITTEDPVAIYENLGRSYILKGDLGEASGWFSKSYRYDFQYFMDVFGWEYLFVTALGRTRMRPPVFGERPDDFCSMVMELEIRADAISMAYGNKKGHKSLFGNPLEEMMVKLADEFRKDPQNANEIIRLIRIAASELYLSI